MLSALPALAAEPEDPEAEPPRAYLAQAWISDARLRFSELRGLTPAHLEIGPVDLRADGIATLREHRGPYRVDIRLPGEARLGWEGEISLHPLASEGRLQLRGFRPDAVWAFVRDQVRLAPPRGVLDASFGYAVGYGSKGLRLRASEIELALRELSLQRVDDPHPILQLQAIELGGGEFDLGSNALRIGEIAVRDGRVAAAIDRTEGLDWSSLLIAGTDRAPPPPALWPQINAADHEYLALRLEGRWLPAKTLLTQATTELGAGFWVMTPLQQNDHTQVLVNRGFVPADQRTQWQTPEPPTGAGERVTVEGLLRISEPGGGFLRRNAPEQQRWHSRDVAAMAQALQLPNAAPYFVDVGFPNRQGATNTEQRPTASGPWPRSTVNSFVRNPSANPRAS